MLSWCPTNVLCGRAYLWRWCGEEWKKDTTPLSRIICILVEKLRRKEKHRAELCEGITHFSFYVLFGERDRLRSVVNAVWNLPTGRPSECLKLLHVGFLCNKCITKSPTCLWMSRCLKCNVQISIRAVIITVWHWLFASRFLQTKLGWLAPFQTF